MSLQPAIQGWIDTGWDKARAVHELVSSRLRSRCNRGKGGKSKRRMERIKCAHESRCDDAAAEMEGEN